LLKEKEEEMITVEELKRKFPVENVPPYGKCIVVPEVYFSFAEPATSGKHSEGKERV